MEKYIITGYSGAGKTIALKTLEDAGFFCVDNLPPELFFSYIQNFFQKPNAENLALGIDVRSGKKLNNIIENILSLNSAIRPKIIFLAATKATLIKRFQETRRKHPLAKKQGLNEAIEEEMILLDVLRDFADIVIETDNLNLHELRHIVRKVCIEKDTQKTLVTLMSFGFKYGIPNESNFLYDVRMLPNPYFIRELKELAGTDPKIHEYLFTQEVVNKYYKKLSEFVDFTLQQLTEKGIFFSTIAIGCTGGKHRSVAIVEKLATEKNQYATFIVKHRDIEKE